jgi:hypothetical protein
MKKELGDIQSHVDLIEKYASKCDHITEMGVREVNSTWLFLNAKPKRIVSIDWDKPPFQVCRESLADFNKAAKEAGVEFEFISSDTTEIAIEKTELLYIDTWHSYEQLFLELLRHSDSVEKYIVMHDTNEKVFPGMTCAIEDFLNLNPQWQMEFMLIDYPGITIIERTSNWKTNWGSFVEEDFIEEIQNQVEMFFEDCTEKDGPKSKRWFDYCIKQKIRFSNSERWPKANMI